MPGKIKLSYGDFVDKDKKLIYIKEAPRTGKKDRRRVKVYDTEYDEYFEALLGDIRAGKTKHGPITREKLRPLKRRQWEVGTIKEIQGEQILFIEEIEPTYYIDKNDIQHPQRRGHFKNLRTGKEFYDSTGHVVAGQNLGSRFSRGERKIKDVLTALSLNFKTQYIFVDCVSDNQKPLRFDFYLPDYNICIEYDGEQHYTGWYRKDDDLQKVQRRDAIKTQYCKDNNITLIRIPYWDLNRINEDYLKDLICED